MIELRKSMRISFGLGILSGLAIFFSNLALLDIWHGESDVALEWRIVQVSYLVFILFHISALIAIGRWLRRRSEEERRPR